MEKNSTSTTIMATVYMISVGSIGLIANFLSMAIIFRNSALHNTFGFVCFSHLVANIGILICFCTWPVLMILSQDNDVAHSPVGKVFGQFTIIFWYACMFAHIGISLNRYISIVYPVKAMKLFTTSNTRYAIIVFWLTACFFTIPYFWNETCYMAFNAHTFQWTYAATTCGQALSHFDFGAGVVLYSSAFLIDLMTLCSLRTVNNTMGTQTAAQAAKRRQNEVRLFTQAFTQCIIFCICLFSFHIFTLISDNLWWQFAMVTMVWISAHSLDGLIVIAFHYRSLFPQKLRTLSTTVTVTGKISQQHSSRC